MRDPKVRAKNGQRLKKDIAEGNHPFGDKEKQRELCQRSIANGTHAFAGERGSLLQKQRIKNGTHNFCIQNTKRYQCEYCSMKTTLGNYKRWHGDKCRYKT